MSAKEIAAEKLAQADLIVDAIYQDGRKGNAGDDPLPRLCGSTVREGSATAAKSRQSSRCRCFEQAWPITAHLADTSRTHIAALLIEGKTGKEVARALDISPRTVDVYRTRLLRKYDAPNTEALIQLLLQG
ncbi:LuxR C-terminal-related transcriptional regulator [Rhizobium leguminosarum]|uniref:LuxR C-terminal-related transcriptional regulator n=1 Tax=Rhizobium leguminosarum TaxID=384 RepID=UPI00048918EA|nr:LuxR C-terminal-related transcriptional regulator [Rhizobium leguminosarum]